MPIYEQTYREYDGVYRQRFRWMIIVQQELRILIKSRFFLLMLLATLLHFLARLMIITVFDVIAQDPNSPLAMAFAGFQEFEVNAYFFYDFLQKQTGIVLLVTIFSGAGMICNDFKNNLMEIYFSKPITWRDYAFGKVAALGLIASAHSVIPALILLGLHNLMLPGIETIKESWWWTYAILGYSAAYILPCILAVLASSAIIRSKNFASVVVFMLLFANTAMGGTLGIVLRDPNYFAVAFPQSVEHIGLHLFRIDRLMFPLAWGWCALYVVAVCAVSLYLILRRVRRAETAQ